VAAVEDVAVAAAEVAAAAAVADAVGEAAAEAAKSSENKGGTSAKAAEVFPFAPDIRDKLAYIG
jgi:hypothetical protein